MNTIKFKKMSKSFIWYIAVLLISLVTVFPLIWTVSTSFKPTSEILSNGMNLIPKMFTWDNYKDVFSTTPFARYLVNSLILAVGGVLSNLFFGSLAGYAFAKLPFKGKKGLFMTFLGSMMIPAVVTMIPSFLVLKNFPLMGGNDITGHGGMGFINTYWAILIPGAAGAFSIFFMKQFFETLPDELSEAARIDGCSEFKIFWKIYMPLAKTALATLGIMTFQAGWNQFMWPLIVLNSQKMMTVQVGLASFQYNESANYGALMAGTIVSTIPVLFVFIFAQKYFVEGIAHNGGK
ncbi:carbohydrate ABC transporter permease [Listeria welshimeri]|uniref:Carbohydrate ABC transporter permease n=2 Tax=Listeria welshimeri TaxID=1643 RepID=A0ABX4IG64_LISWE|nr:carbohydrate ABC transporter permease [Listeria welshimeri]MBC1242821.1 carbohydrate ABC transporter permease [Listeria welshimeri]MBC1249688.1 carbohydrate ABC transporter permease [Listeria welshimeri]MBC1251299.1 carbohydrate ABC transporter permease [Listeria welshimeri]MBC1282312.1 carbohydrate ABC transporter permease [Listeria welshimeri]MBC1339841.1 carbohydrate ABC transporter permease [Listeria welshimeri]